MVEIELVFNKNAIRQVVFCAILMSSIDGFVDEKEWEVIDKFVELYWTDEFGDFPQLRKQIEEDLEQMLATDLPIEEKLDRLSILLKSHLDSEQKKILIKLVLDVMLADDIIHPNESRLFIFLTDILYKSPQT